MPGTAVTVGPGGGGGELRRRLGHVRWIGGGSGAGKSTVAERIAARYGLRLYRTDEVMGDHARRSSTRDAPYLSRFLARDMDQRWVTDSPARMAETFHWFRGEGFGLIVEDLLRMPAGPGIVVEGFRLLPRLVEPLLSDPRHAVWLLPTPEFRRAAFDRRGTTWDIAGRTSDPELALANLLERDRLFTDHLAAETGRLGLPSIPVVPGPGEDDLVDQVARALGR
jgi:hypothetical protein